MSDTVKLVIEIDEEVWDWFVTRSFIPIMYYDSLADSMENAVPLSEELDEIKGEIAEIPKKYPMTKEYEYGLNEAVAIIDKHISGEGDSE